MNVIEYIDMTVEGPKVIIQLVVPHNVLLPSYGDTIHIKGKMYNIDDRIFRMQDDGIHFQVTLELQALDK